MESFDKKVRDYAKEEIAKCFNHGLTNEETVAELKDIYVDAGLDVSEVLVAVIRDLMITK